MLLAARCACCGRRGASPCPDCWSELRGPAPERPPPGLDDLVVLLRYEGPARPLVARVKYRNHRQAVPWLGAALADRVHAAGVVVDVVTWAPTTPEHRAARGFDHAEVLAREVARGLGVPARGIVRRVRGAAQTGRTAADRRARPPTFAARPPTGDGEAAVLVVDDVVTTGATLAAAARALRAAGWGVVPAAVARTPPPGARRGPPDR